MKNYISRWSGESTHPFLELQRSVDRLFDDFFSGPVAATAQGKEAWFAPACDVRETESHYVMSMDVPGVRKDELNIELKGSQLYVSGKRREEELNSRGRLHLVERRQGRFERVFNLPDAIEPERIEAEYQDGVLAIAVPKAAAAKRRQIPVISQAEGKPGFMSKVLGRENTKDPEKVA